MTGLTIALNRIPEFADAVASFFVTDPVKSLNIDRGYSADSTSQVNVFDDEAINGYVIKARLDPAVDTNFAVRIWSASSVICTATNPCQLSTNDMVIYGNGTNSATLGSGDIINFSVRINASMAANIGINDVDIIYTKERAYTMQAFSTAACNAMPVYYPAASPPAGSEIDLVDIRDGKTYKIRKLPTNTIGTTGQCWMVDNLALQPMPSNPMTLNSANSDLAGTWTFTAASVIDPNTAAGQTYCADLDTAIYPNKCGMQYTWAAISAGSSYSTPGSSAGSICPRSWRWSTASDYTTLSTALSWGSSGANVNSLTGFRGLYAGRDGATDQGIAGWFWTTSSTSTSGVGAASAMTHSASSVTPNTGGTSKTGAFSLRCIAK